MALFKSLRGATGQFNGVVSVMEIRREKLEWANRILLTLLAKGSTDMGRSCLCYDVSGLGFEDIEPGFEQVGVKQPTSFRWRGQSAWYRLGRGRS